MENITWVLLVLVFGLSKGARDLIKKKALQKNTVMEVLVTYTILSFVLVLPFSEGAFRVPSPMLGWIAVKSLVIFFAWMCSFKAIEYIPISVIGVIDLSRVLFSTLFGVVFLHETMGMHQVFGLLLVCTGLLLLRVRKDQLGLSPDRSRSHGKYIGLVFVSCVLNAISGTMDKVLMQSVTSSQLQFWYMLFLSAMYVAYVLLSRTKIRWKEIWKNYWIWILSVVFVIADRSLFIANGIVQSKVTVMTLIKQSGVLVSIVGGKIFFREEKIGYKLLCAGIIIAGILVAVV